MVRSPGSGVLGPESLVYSYVMSKVDSELRTSDLYEPNICQMIFFRSTSFIQWSVLSVLSLSLLSCSGRRPAEPPVATTSPVANPEPAPPPPTQFNQNLGQRSILYDQTASFQEPVSNFDVLHTTLDLRFDFPGERVIGSATHRLTPTVDALRRLHFDGRDMEIRAVSILGPQGDFQDVAFQYDNKDITISLQNPVGRTVALEVRIDYLAHPMRNGRKLGMVFVDGAETDPSRPTQVWTLGQPEDNQYWYPSWDYPNDRMTFDISLTVPARFSTVANGDLVEQTPQPDGLRRDRWVLNRPHASYLAGFVIGEFTASVENYTRRDGSSVPLGYLVEPQHAGNAKLIFSETAAIMRYLEDQLRIAYPWSNYKQVAVREFTARGMENTTATVLYDDIQHDARAHHDFTGVKLITHELAHQWFGNLVTSRNWANLPLNEGFARYFERLYAESSRGLAEAQAQTIEDRRRYFEQARELRRPIIWHGYSDPNEMYDRHTYEKAALVLHQLRLEIGDEAWWNGVRRYLRDHAYGEAVIDDLQRAMEQASGRNLAGFFNQWYRRPGHPKLDVKHRYFPDRGLYEIQVRQIQDSLAIGNFSFEVDIEVNMTGAEPWVERYRVASTDTTYRFAIPGGMSFARFDAGDWALAEITVTKSLSEWLNQLAYDDEPAGRYDAVVALKNLQPGNEIQDALIRALRNDQAAFVRQAAAEALGTYADQTPVRDQLLSSVQSDEKSVVRRTALNSLGSVVDDHLLQALRAGVNDASYFVAADAVRLLTKSYPADAVSEIRPLFEVKSWNNIVETAIIEAYGELRSLEGISYLQERLKPEADEEVQIASVRALSSIASAHSDVQRNVAQSILAVLNHPQEPVRFAAVQALQPLNNPEILANIRGRIPSESSTRVRQAMELLSNDE